MTVKEKDAPVKVKSYSATKTKDVWEVYKHSDGNYSCTCPDWKNRRAEKGEDCKHIARYKKEKGVK